MLEYFLLSLLLVASPSLDVIEAQDQSGYISIDCGLQGSNNTDLFSGLYYTSDAKFVDSGVSQSVATIYQSNNNLDNQFKTLRYFPEGSRNCYTLRPVQGKGSKYLIRARFMYGDYDSLNQPPKFDLHIGNQYWETVKVDNASILYWSEIIHTPPQDYVHICLVKTGPGITFISTLELRPLTNKMYPTAEKNVSLNCESRLNLNPTEDEIKRFKDDIYDRIWSPYFLPDTGSLSSTFQVKTGNFFEPPSVVMGTAAVGIKTSDHLIIRWDATSVNTKYYFFLHFAELEALEADQIRVMDIFFNDEFFSNVTPSNLSINTVYSGGSAFGNTSYTIDIAANNRTTLPPILNAFELYSLVEFSLLETFGGDVEAMVNIKVAYNLTENWQGDPCGPEGFQWIGVNCTKNDGLTRPNIISLDLSNNNLTGVLPDFLATLDSLTLLNLKGNNFTKSCPQQLIAKANTGKLTLISDSLCADGIVVDEKKEKKKSSIVLPIVGAAGGVFIVICVSFLAFYIRKGQKKRGASYKVDMEAEKRFNIRELDNNVIPNSLNSNATTESVIPSSSHNDNSDFVVMNKSRQFTYHEVLQITNNFQAVIGKGGFGTVYHGYVGNAQVAVKMLSPSSSQGYKEFQAEAGLLLTIHHKNLTSLVGYCYEGTNMAIIYDYMPNGNMEKHLLGKGTYVLTWEERLRMAIDAAQGLEYLHHGCRPPIVHRDIKLTNILVDEKFRVKLADFGLSRAFSVEEATHVSTVVAGTPGYLDPEYHTTIRLTEKSDIYSFGIVLLEVVTGRPALPRNSEMSHIIAWVSSALENGDLDNIVDPKLRADDYAMNSIWKVLEVAMSYVARNSVRRPTMNFVVMELNASLTMEISRNETGSKDSIGLVSMNMETGFNPRAR